MAGLSSILKPGTSGSTISHNRSGIPSGANDTSTHRKGDGSGKFEAAVAEGIQNQGQYAANYSTAQKGAGGVSFSGVRDSWFKNGNPMARGGTATMTMNNRNFTVPNAFAQAMQYRQAVNQGRWSLADLLPGQSEAAKAQRPYEDYGLMEAQINNQTQKYDVNRQTRGDVEAGLEEERRKYAEMMKPQVLKEEIAANGQVMKSNALERQQALLGIKQRMDALSQSLRSMIAKRDTGGGNNDWSGMESILKSGPTRSNLPIKETVVFAK